MRTLRCYIARKYIFTTCSDNYLVKLIHIELVTIFHTNFMLCYKRSFPLNDFYLIRLAKSFYT